MKKIKAAAPELELRWREERETLTLEGEPVLEYALSWPEVYHGGLGGRWITRYYARLASTWRQRWRREVYWSACLTLAEQRAASRPFTPWAGQLSGQITYAQGSLLSLRFLGQEVRGDGRPNLVRWGDTWKVREGAPCPLNDLFPTVRKRDLIGQMIQQGQARRTAGDLFLDQGWESRLSRLLPLRDYCLTDQGLELALPQSAIAPAAEGTPVFLLPMPSKQASPDKGRAPAQGEIRQPAAK